MYGIQSITMVKIMKKALYKLLNNAVYGKEMERLNRIDVKLVNNDKDYLECTSKPR